jgi:hypothetical protein
MPLIKPFGLKVQPGGKDPAATDQVKGATPFAAANVWVDWKETSPSKMLGVEMIIKVGGATLNVAPTVAAEGPPRMQGEKSHAPLQPTKTESGFGSALRVTLLPTVNSAEHVVPQSIPGGEETTFPVPVPLRSTVIEYWPKDVASN